MYSLLRASNSLPRELQRELFTNPRPFVGIVYKLRGATPMDHYPNREVASRDGPKVILTLADKVNGRVPSPITVEVMGLGDSP